MLKHFEILSRVLQLCCNIVVHKHAEIKGDDWTDRKQIFHTTTILHIYPAKEAGVDCCCRRCSDPNPDISASPSVFERISNNSDTYAVSTFLILALKQGSHI